MEPKPPRPSRLRRRRILIAVLVLVGVIYFLGLPQLDAFDLDFPVNRANIAQLMRGKGSGKGKFVVPEIYGVLHVVTSADAENEHVLAGTDDPTKPMDVQLYAPGKPDIDWLYNMQTINEQFPLVVFSKTYCPFSKRAKALLQTYRLSPPPKIIEVDLRDDAEHLKQLLARLTHHGTFPNNVLLGQSLGGFDQLNALHNDGKLRKMLEGAGITVGNPDV
ncbi:Glutaredoxin domain protein [Mycena chlorophos]|uniref:Glutaredoxin domain protein n=1 Tax=Mycena chlorophos TaxID=658473 RepID=A0A8H6TWQ1_MYCCL|nr:Glutaredoxin domain protein [Mycena chlorophos]